MASVFKATYKVRDKATGDFIRGKDGKPIRRKYGKWSIKYKDATGKWVIVPGFRDKQASQTHANELERRSERKRVGLIDKYDEHSRTELAKHVDDFRASLVAKDNSAGYVAQRIARIQAVISGCQFHRVDDIAEFEVEEFLSNARQSSTFGNRTSNYYLSAMKQFMRWLIRNHRAKINPLSELEELDADDDSPRRAISAEEFECVIAAARASTDKRRRPSGPDMAVIYMLAARTGFRARECWSLTPRSFDWEAEAVTVEKKYSKRRRTDTQPLRSDLIALMRPYLEGRDPAEQIWPGQWYRRAAERLRIDLTAAEVPYVDAHGLVFDFHALRHTYITNLARGGIYGKILQQLARHSSERLTAKYTHLTVCDTKAALDVLPPLPSEKQRKKKLA